MSTIRLKDLTTEEGFDLDFADVKHVQVVSLTLAKIERQDGITKTYDLGIDGIRRLKEWVLRESAAEPNKTCPTGTVVTNDNARAALEDLISHGPNILEALNQRVERARTEDIDEVQRLSSSGEEWRGATDANESYWKREHAVVERMIRQAHFALGRTPE